MSFSPRTIFISTLMTFLGILPIISSLFDEPFYTVLFSRMLVLSIGAISLNLILGFGGMVSFGHAVYMGIGAYVVGIGIFHNLEDSIEWMGNGFLHFIIAIKLSAFAALIIGVF